MDDVHELCPGVYAVPGGLSFCPGCGLEAMGLDPEDSQGIRDWFKGTFAALEELGVPGLSEETAEAFAEDYLRSPCHDRE